MQLKAARETGQGRDGEKQRPVASIWIPCRLRERKICEGQMADANEASETAECWCFVPLQPHAFGRGVLPIYIFSARIQ